jgi:uncharacterized protein YjaZ
VSKCAINYPGILYDSYADEYKIINSEKELIETIQEWAREGGFDSVEEYCQNYELPYYPVSNRIYLEVNTKISVGIRNKL